VCIAVVLDGDVVPPSLDEGASPDSDLGPVSVQDIPMSNRRVTVICGSQCHESQ